MERSAPRGPAAFHTAIVRSSEHVTTLCAPPGSNDAHHTVLSCPPSSFESVFEHDQSSPSGSSVQILIVSSYDVDMSTSSVGCHVTHLTSWEWPLSTATHSKSFPGCSSQIHTDLSRPQVASSVPLGDHAQDLTSFSWPSTTATHSQSPPLCVQTAVEASNDAVARSRPHGDHDTCRTVRLCTPSSSATVTQFPPAAALCDHSRHVLSEDVDARHRPRGSHCIPQTRSSWPSSSATSSIVTALASEKSGGADGGGGAPSFALVFAPSTTA
mmetsp:Transcript_12150/g.43781  ORF Transcript_12150/g.43781 Transcript_12150/m.43781 type:complete len:270 (-) Transcript_12150:882-1691(-)